MILIESPIQARFGRGLRRRALSVFLRQAARAAQLPGEVSVLLTGDAEIRRLNREFRRQDRPTDVLSFPVSPHAPEEDLCGAPESGLAGDLAISVETAARQAEEAGHSLFVELQSLLLHGVLHLAGYDHETDSGEMARKETALRRRFGLAAGLIERSGKLTSARTGQTRGARRGRRKP
ncbi:MAG TPA: rRNA maturation RNase YbeY [Acidobacteriaceae bacterium]|nr:rRNA maturation RNase YbeY [Acidobacteriaceae bacterium]